MSQLSGNLRSVHLWHAVVKQYKYVHLRLAMLDKLKPLLNILQAFCAIASSVASVASRLQQGLHHFYVNYFVVDDQDFWQRVTLVFDFGLFLYLSFWESYRYGARRVMAILHHFFR